MPFPTQIVFKYPLVPGMQQILLPNDSVVLSAAFQHGLPVMWVKHSTLREHARKSFYFMLTGTGHEFSSEETYRFVSTFMTDDGTLVLHLFEVVT